MTWNLNANLAGVAVSDGTYKPLPTGAYKVKIVSTEQYTKQETGNVSIKFQLSVIDGEHKGDECRIYIGTDLSKKGNMSNLKMALLSIGTNAAVLEQGSVNVSSKTFDGKTAFIFVKEKDATDPASRDDVRFITKDRFEAEAGKRSAMNGSGIPQPGGNLDTVLGGVSL